jgi:fucose 4-O-acetylase-like acetyltransferase
VLGHSLQQDMPIESGMRDLIYIFHMPLFFFVSGYLFNVKGDFKAYMQKNIYSLLIPYVFLNVVAFILWLPVYIHGNHDVLEKIVNFVIGDSHAPAGPAWFLLCLFWVRIGAYWLHRVDTKIQVVAIIFCCILSYYFPIRLYWCLDSTFMALPFFMVGVYFKTFEKEGYLKFKFSIFTLFIFLFATIGISLLQENTDVNYRIMGLYPLLYFPGAIIGVLFVYNGSLLIKDENRLISVFASGSIIIMGLHGCFNSYLCAPFGVMLPLTITDHWAYPVVMSLLVLFVMYYPILFIQKYFSRFIGGR